MSLKNIFNYAKQFSTTLNAGLPINRVLETLARTAPTRQLRAVSKKVNQSIESGATLAQAFEKHDRVFPDFFRKMIHVAESTGRLEQVAASLSEYYEGRYAVSRAARQELYPVVGYFALLMAAVLFIEWILGGAAALKNYTDILAWVILVGMAVWGAYFFSSGFRDAVGSLLFHAPFVQRLVRKFCLSKFCEGMQLASEAGLDVREGISLSAEGAGNAAFRKRALRARESIDKGCSISEALEKTGLFPFEAMQMFIVGEQTGKLHEAMGHVSKLAREQAVTNLRLTLVFAIRGLYVLIIIYIGFVVVSFYSRIYSGILGS